jgi:sporulation protein YlmC with PRC-barrel domain
MARISIFLWALVFAFGFMVTNAWADDQMAMSMGKPSALSSLVSTDITNQKGEYLGRVADFVIDSQGHVTFVVVAHGGFLRFNEKEVAVPFGAFSYDRYRMHFVLDLTQDKLYAAPAFTKRDLFNEKWAGDVYRYFGQAPYWTEGELVERGVKPMDQLEEGDLEGTFNPYGSMP